MHICIFILTAASLSVAMGSEFERWDLPRRNKTIEREEAGDIKTVWPDLRLSGIYTRPAMGMPRGGGSVDLYFKTNQDARNNLLTNDEGTHQALGVVVSQNLYWEWLWFDTTLEGTRNDFDDADNLSDIRTVLVVSPWHSRYQSTAIEGGVEMPATTGSDLNTNHQKAWQLPTFVLGGRYSGAWGFAVLHANLRLKLQATGVTDNKFSRTDDEGNLIPAGEWKHRFMSGELPIGVSYRFLRMLRIGLEMNPTYRAWHSGDDDGSITDWGVPTTLYGEFSPLGCMAIRGGLGYDWADVEARRKNSLSACNLSFSTVLHW